MRIYLGFLLIHLTILFLIAAGPAAASRLEESACGGKLDIFLDTNANRDYIRENIRFVNYVRDREQAQLHLLITSQGAGGVGVEYTMLFTGLKEFRGVNDTLRCIAREP
jgi:hypothetical protein